MFNARHMRGNLFTSETLSWGNMMLNPGKRSAVLRRRNVESAPQYTRAVERPPVLHAEPNVQNSR